MLTARLPAAASVVQTFDRSPFDAFKILGNQSGVGDDDCDQGIGMNSPACSLCQGIDINRVEPVGESCLVIDRQTMDDQVGAAVH